MELYDELVLFFSEVSSFEIRAKVIDPSKAAAFSATKKAGGLRERPPTSLAVHLDVGGEPLVFLLSPSSLIGVSFLATWRSTHGSQLPSSIPFSS